MVCFPSWLLSPSGDWASSVVLFSLPLYEIEKIAVGIVFWEHVCVCFGGFFSHQYLSTSEVH